MGRNEVDYIVSNLIDPNALIDPAHRLTTVFDTFVTLRTQETRVRLAMKDVAEVLTSNPSMMPEGIVKKNASLRCFGGSGCSVDP